MKKLFFILSLMLVMFAACEQSAQNDGKTAIKILSELPIKVDFHGGEQMITYTIANPLPDVELQVSCSEQWISDLVAKNGVMKFVVARNTESDDRMTIIKLTYGEIVEQILVAQSVRPDDAYDYDITATIFGGEYTGNNGEDSYNYYVQLGNGEIDEFNDDANAYYYYFDIYVKGRGGDHPILPNGTYNFDRKNSQAVGTFTQEFSKAHFNDAAGQHAEEFEMASGRVTVTDNKFEALVYMTDGTVHHIVYEGELYVPSVLKSPDYGSKLTKDLEFDLSTGYLRLFYYGDDYGIGADYWSLALMEDPTGMSGAYVQVKIITDSLNDKSYESIAGIYTPCSDIEPQKNSFLKGLLEGQMYIGSQYYFVVDSLIDNNQGAPIYDGQIEIKVENNSFNITMDCMDDNDHKIKGTFSCSGAEFYDRSGK